MRNLILLAVLIGCLTGCYNAPQPQGGTIIIKSSGSFPRPPIHKSCPPDRHHCEPGFDFHLEIK